MTESVRNLFPDTQPGPVVEDLGATFLETARAVAKICATRMLLMIAVIVGSGIWGFTVYMPTPDRLYAAVAFSLVFVLPLTALYLRKG
jgi:hypothetical protein